MPETLPSADVPAIEMPGVREELKRRREMSATVWGYGAGAQVVIGFVGFVLGPPFSGYGLLFVLAGFGLAVVALVGGEARNRELQILETYPWREWRYRAVGDPRKNVVQQGNRTSERLLDLIAPDGTTAARFPEPEYAPGTSGTVWLAGDPRYGGILAAPGGASWRRVTVAHPSPAPADADALALARLAGLID